MTINLSGSLSEFSLSEVLSLLGMGGRTARMQVTTADAVGTVHLVEGRISSATSDSTRAGLLRGVVAALPVPADDLAQALTSDEPVRTLVESGVVERDAAQHVASEHATEAVGEMLDWATGEFAVWVGSHDPADIGVRLEVEQTLAAAGQRAQEWRDLRAALPESDTVLALAPEVDQAPVLDRDDWAVLARVDGRRTLTEVLAALGASPLAAGNRLVQLMGRGLVAVQVRGDDAEQELAHRMIDAFEVGPVDGVIELVAPLEPEPLPDVHDLFVTEPEAVEEWQVAGSEPWVVAEAAPVEGVDPAAGPAAEEEHAPAPWAALVAPEFPSGPEPVMSQSFRDEVEPVAYELDASPAAESLTLHDPTPTFEVAPMAFEAVPAVFDLDVDTSGPEPVAYDLGVEGFAQASVAAVDEAPVEVPVEAPVSFALEPEVQPAAESFSWSPWAREMGLGEAPVAPAAQVTPVGHGFADMVEDSHGPSHTADYPVPLEPVAVMEHGQDAMVVAGATDEATQFVPQPRDPGDGFVDPAEQVGAHAASLEAGNGPDATTDVATDPSEPGVVEEQPEPAPDPLAGGLLAHLMSSVRGL
jgi:hypothetical protein